LLILQEDQDQDNSSHLPPFSNMGQACLDGLLSADAAAAATSAGLSKCNLEHAKAAFLASDLGSSYGYQGWLDRHWWQEVGVRFGPGQHYLDYTGELLLLLLRCC
jgi:hypothetical protein